MATAASLSLRARRVPVGTEADTIAGRPHLWTVDEYHRIGDAGGFEEKVELIDGVIVDKWSDGDTIEERRHRWTREEFERLAENGAFGDLRIEMIYGEVVDMSPQGNRHYTVMRRVEAALKQAYGAGYDIRVQGPFATPVTVLEPDIVVVEGTPDDYEGVTPTTGLLAAEISVSSLSHDRDVKADVYALAGIPEYWIVNALGSSVEVYRDPTPEGIYGSKRTLMPGDTLAPLLRPDAAISVADLLHRTDG